MTEPLVADQKSQLLNRVRSILLSPRAEWARIDVERATVRSIYVPYVLLLVAIGPLAVFIGGQVFGYGALGVTIRPTLLAGLITAVVSYGLALAGVYILALVIEALAPSFDGTKDRIQALKVAAYSSTAAWLAAVFHIFPPLGFLAIAGLYSLYLLYLGLPVLMKAPQDKALGYTVVTVIVAIVLWAVVGFAGNAVTGAVVGGAGIAGAGAASVVLPGGDRIETRGLEDAARRMEEASARIAEGRATPVAAPADLAALLPASVAGLNRVSQESGQSGFEGMSASNAEAVYESGDARITLTITDMGDMAALGNLAGALGVQSSRESDDGYERIGRVDGRMTTETWSRSNRQGDYGVMVAERVNVQARGSNVDMDAVKAAVNAVDFRRLEQMVR